MMASVASGVHRLRWPFVPLLLAYATAMALLPPAARSAEAQITVHLDQAKILRLPDRTATLVIGNPLIADVAVQPGGVVVVTGKSYGVTNLIALDRDGRTLTENAIEVEGAKDKIVVVYRGTDRESYSCTPNCERRITLGDTPAYFTATMEQSDKFTAQAQKATTK
jgi:Flp pilus assembly secretin CpaC